MQISAMQPIQKYQSKHSITLAPSQFASSWPAIQYQKFDTEPSTSSIVEPTLGTAALVMRILEIPAAAAAAGQVLHFSAA